MNAIDQKYWNNRKFYAYLCSLATVFLCFHSTIYPTNLYAKELEQGYWAQCDNTSLGAKQLPKTAVSNEQYNFSNFLQPGVINMVADKIIADKEQNFILQGDIQIQKSNARLTGNLAKYQRSNAHMEVEGDIRFELDNLLLTGDSAEFNLEQRTGSVQQSRIWLLDRHLRGAAKRIDIDQEEIVHLNQAWLTSCDEGKEDWRIKASQLSLNRTKNLATAKHARIEFYNVPIFYFPYFSYPITGRKTGLLVPRIGSSSASGTSISLPYYLNLMPHRDATLTLDYYSRRGAQLRTEFRYLNPRNHGQINYDVLPKDKKTGEDSHHLVYKHNGIPVNGVATSIDFNYVSDNNYLKDFGGDLGVASTSFLNQRANISYSHKYFNVSGLVQNFQTIDESINPNDHPYKRLPQINFNSHDLALTSFLQFRFNSEITQFDRELGVIGNRTDLYPQFYIPMESPAGFLTPKLGIRYTQWNLERQSDTSLDAENQRTLPIASLDGGLFFERRASLGFMQTLEPRLYYLYVPYMDQSNLIDVENNTLQTFDSNLMYFNLSQLFSENRFSGKDLIGDANQLSVSLTSRLLDNQGKERIRATIGQLVYFEDRRVNLVRGQVDTNRYSDTLFEFNSRWNRHLSTRFDLVWNNSTGDVGQGGVRISYQKDHNRLLNVSYRYEKKQIDQVEARIVWPIHRNWKPVLYWRYSLLDRRNLENYQGIEYDSCCWSFRLVRRDYIQNAQDRNISVLLEFELKGLSSVGNRASKMFGLEQY